MIFGILASAITSLAAFAFPTFASYKAIKANDNSQLVPWLMFWSVQACLLFAEHWVYFILQWVPLYREIKMIITLWLVLPQTQGATQLYLHYIHPSLAKHEQDLDDLIVALHHQIKNRGGQYVELVILKLSEILFGSKPGLPSDFQAENGRGPAEATTPGGSDGYIASLFSRFRTVPVGSHPETLPSSLMSFLSLSEKVGGDIIPADLSAEERRKYVNRQKAKLQEWLHMLEAAEKSYPPIDITNSGSASSAVGRRTNARSASGHPTGARTPTNTDSDYEDLGTDEMVRKGASTTASPASGGWFWKSRTE